MKSINKFLIIIFVIISIPKASLAPHFQMGSYGMAPTLYLSLFFKTGYVKIDSGYKFKSVLRDSAVADSLYILVTLPKIRIKKLSFSRNDTAYCYANKFPPSDSLKWRLLTDIDIKDTLKLRDSILELGLKDPHRFMQVTWHLNKKYTFNKGDTFSLVLAEIPDRLPPSNTLPQNCFSMNPVNSQQPGKFIILGGASIDFYQILRQTHGPLFDISGKRLLFAPRKSFVFIMPSIGK
jgi:hypothetical protein